MAAPTLVSSWYAYYVQPISLACAKLGGAGTPKRPRPALFGGGHLRRRFGVDIARAIVFIIPSFGRLLIDGGRGLLEHLVGVGQERAPRPLTLGFVPGGAGLVFDGQFGPGTERAVKAFQQSAQLSTTGVVDQKTLCALDARLAATELRTPAEVSGDALKFLSDAALSLPKLSPLVDRSQPAAWNHPEIQKAYGEFVGAYWEHCKTNRVECDCKTLSLFLMDQFRGKVKADLGVQLPRPTSLPASTWVAATAADPKGFFGRFETLAGVRPGYDNAQAIQRLDPKASMLVGVNLRYANVDANMASRAVKVTIPWTTARDNGGDSSVPELPVAQLNAGDVIFIDHTGDGKVDHMANVVKVQRNAEGLVTSLVLATGSFDDMKDADGSTAPSGLGEVNNYVEEVTVQVDAAGKVTSSKVTWSSEPAWLSEGRYSARTLLMEMRPGGKISAGRWG